VVRSPFLLIEAAAIEKEVRGGKWRVNTSDVRLRAKQKASRDKCIDAHDFLFSSRKGDSDLDPVAWNPQNRREALTTSISRQDTYGIPALTHPQPLSQVDISPILQISITVPHLTR